MTLQLALLLGYSALLVGLGLWIGRRVSGTKDFFVAGRQLGPGLIFSTMLAANIGAGSTVGATGLGYRDGIAAWWWVGSAAIGSLVLALWIGPRIRAVAARHDLKTVGDFLELRYGAQRSRDHLAAALDGIARHPRRPADRDRVDPQRRRRRAEVRGVPHRRRRRDRLLHRRRSADVGVGQHGAAHREARSGSRSRCRSRCTASAGGARVRAVQADDASYWNPWQRRRVRLDVSRAARARVHRLARPAAENLRRARRPRRAARRRDERARPAAVCGRAAADGHHRRARDFRTCRTTSSRCRWS